ncbi:type III secretion system chaperone [Telmatospirillum sp. J64-1]|uniref:type III secretion system chaperone n=1 Tax=Telmatospirillum sp. J64-1 TaxID=2502183 RepID=UPI00115DC084|nr:type III secretion system chaperone [Telmatospirillum sp. J64-1]
MLDESNALIRELGRTLGFEDLAFDDAGTCDLLFDGAIQVKLAIDAQQEEILAISPLAILDQTAGEELLETLLEANFLWSRTAGGTLSLRPDDEAVLMRAWPLKGLDQAAFEEDLRHFIDAAERLAEMILAQSVGTPSIPALDTAPAMPGHAIRI